MQGGNLNSQLEEDDSAELFRIQRTPEQMAETEPIGKDEFMQKFKTNGRYFEDPSPDTWQTSAVTPAQRCAACTAEEWVIRPIAAKT